MSNAMVQASALIEYVQRLSPNAVRLARRVSLAVQVEPELLRKARLELLPGVDAGVEADLWFSPLVQSENARALVFLPEVEKLLRQQLSENQEILDRAWHVLKKVHENAPPAIQLEEEVTWLALSDKPDAPDKIEQHLQSAMAAMIDENRHGLAHWAVRALPRLPESLYRSHTFWVLSILAGGLLGGRRILEEEIPDNIVEGRLHWVFPDSLPRVSMGVRLRKSALELGSPSMPGAHIIELPKTNPFLLEVSWREDADLHFRQVIWLPDQTMIVQVGSGAVTVRTAFGESYTLHPLPIPAATRVSTTREGGSKLLTDISMIRSRQASIPHVNYFLEHKKGFVELEQWIQEEQEASSQNVLRQILPSISKDAGLYPSRRVEKESRKKGKKKAEEPSHGKVESIRKIYTAWSQQHHEYNLFPRQTPSNRTQNHPSNHAKVSPSRRHVGDRADAEEMSGSGSDGQVRMSERSAPSDQQRGACY